MELILKNRNSKAYESFVYCFLPRKISEFAKRRSSAKMNLLNNEFNIDTNKILSIALNNIKVTKSTTSYRLTFDRTKMYKGRDIESWVNLITFGNRSVKGYTIVYDIFDYIVKNERLLYREWLMKCGLL